MITVTNRIYVKKGMAKMMAPNFVKPGPLQQFDGFHKVEVLVSEQSTEHDEMSVVMYWDNEESFAAWRNSDAFKQAHKRPEGAASEPNPNSPIIRSELIVAEVVGSISK